MLVSSRKLKPMQERILSDINDKNDRFSLYINGFVIPKVGSVVYYPMLLASSN